MINRNFYPTPASVISQMVPADWRKKLPGSYILEPSAGKGDIARWIKDNIGTYGKKATIHCVEIDPQLQAILREEKLTVCGTDFLEFQPRYAYDFIIMNPPFDHGVDHLLHAFSIAGQTRIACLLNASNLLDPRTRKELLLRNLIEQYGSYEVLGPVFSQAERRTKVEVAVVWLQKESQDYNFNLFENLDHDLGDAFLHDGIQQEAPLARRNQLETLVHAYDKILADFREYQKLECRMQFYAGDFIDMSRALNVQNSFPDKYASREKPGALIYNRFVENVTQQAWHYVIRKTKIANVMTSSVRQEFETYQQQVSTLPFTVENIEQMFDNLFLHQKQVLLECVVNVHESIRQYHKGNTVHWEGWKTNDAFRVKKKFIHPNLIKYRNWWGWSVDWEYRTGFITDLDKAMCLVDGKKFEQINSLADALEHRFSRLNGEKGVKLPDDIEAYNVVYSTYWRCRFFKKGTVHLWFRDDYLWQEFNLMAAKGKNWLPA